MLRAIILALLNIILILVLWSTRSKAQALPSRDKLVASYTAQLGIREKTGNNDGKEVEMYLKSVNLGKGNPWCAAFVNWNLMQAGATTCKSGWVPHWFGLDKLVYRSGKEIKRLPMQGDCFGIYFASKMRLAHIGFIDKWGEGKYASCVEGNTNEAGSREGDGVYRKYRLKSQIHSVASWLP